MVEDGSDYKVVTGKEPEQMADLLLAWRVAKRGEEQRHCARQRRRNGRHRGRPDEPG